MAVYGLCHIFLHLLFLSFKDIKTFLDNEPYKNKPETTVQTDFYLPTLF